MTGLLVGWTIAELSELTTKIVDGSHNPPPGVEIGVPMLSARNIDGGRINFDAYRLITPEAFEHEDARTAVTPGDVLLTIVGTIGRSAVVPKGHTRFALQRSVAVLRTNDSVTPHYLRHYLQAYETQQWMLERAKGTAQKGIYLGALAKLPCPVPPLAEQRRIVAKLDALTARTARARADLDRIPALAARYKQAVLASCFTPKNSGELVELGSIVAFENGDRGKNYPNENEQRDEGHCLFLGTRNVQHGAFDWSGAKFISRSKHERLSGGTLRRGDIVLTIRGTLGNCAVYDESAPYEVVRINSAMIIVRPQGNVMPRYVMWALRSPAFLGWVGLSARGSAQPHLRASDIKSTKVRLPNLHEQAAIVSRVERAFAEIDRLAAEAAAARRLLDRLDQAVLAKAFRGELVPQDPADEPASILLDRIRAERAAAPKAKRGRKPAAA